MSCGLGAVVLVFMLVKHNVDKKELQANQGQETQAEILRGELNALTRQERDLRQSIAGKDSESKAVEARIRQISAKLSQIQKVLDTKQKTVQDKSKNLADLKKTVENIDAKKTSDVINDQNKGEENYLIGLKVEGKKIAILLDSSSSMTDAILLDVIRRKNGTNREKRSGPKWERTQRIVRWLLARLPKESQVQVISFNSSARPLGGKGWKSSRDAGAMTTLINEVDALVPEGPTNLQSGLEVITDISPSNIYLITDGLPTMGNSNYKSLNPFSDCNALWGRSNTISGPCRLMLFSHTIKSSAPKSGATVNVILLPIEGDPAASAAYWSWTALSGGLLIAPADSWP